jgi:WD40 repeat protein
MLIMLFCACRNSALGQQLGLYDVRLRRTEIHSFGWKQETSDSQSALINQSWSPDGWYISSGTADPKIHIFDIRYTFFNNFIFVA